MCIPYGIYTNTVNQSMNSNDCTHSSSQKYNKSLFDGWLLSTYEKV